MHKQEWPFFFVTGQKFMEETVTVKENDSKSKPDATAKPERIARDLRRARKVKGDWIKAAEEDFEFFVGKQWRTEDKDVLEKAGVPALTINKIQPNIFLASGFQRQNRSDWVAYPEGDEDGLEAEIVTKLLKNAVKTGDGEYIVSEQFEDGIICGEGWIEPYIDYNEDLINGDLFLVKDNPFMIFVDPDSVKYDLSDAEFVIKISPKLSRDQVVKLFPDKEELIDSVDKATVEYSIGSTSDMQQTIDYPMVGQEDKAEGNGEMEVDEKAYDLVEYYYKKYVSKYVVADKSVGSLKEAKSKEEADNYVNQVNQAAYEQAQLTQPGIALDPQQFVVAKVLKRQVTEIWVCAMLGKTVIDEYISPFYPRWKSYPFFPYFAHRITTPLPKAREYMTQGIVRSLKDPQRELNKRRSQELRILNSTANSGWLAEEGAWKEKSVVEKYGSTPGVTLEYKANKPKPERITPAPLSQGHAQLAAENTQDMKEISGINADLLAMQDKGSDASGRAIHLRQQQGILMLQRILDNFSRTQKMIGKFILSQLGELYTVESAMRVMGDSWIKDNFSVPVLQPSPVDGKPTPILDGAGKMQMQVDMKTAQNVFQLVLNGVDEGKYNIKIDEVNSSPTVKLANYSMLLDLVSKGVPVPPDVLVDESQIGEGTKSKIKKAIASAMSAQNAIPAAKTGQEGAKK